MTPEEEKELRQICGSEEFSEGAEKLLMFLGESMGHSLTAGDVERSFYGFAEDHPLHKPSRSRGAILDLRERLDEYRVNHPESDWTCEFAPRGYELILQRKGAQRPSDVFWSRHLDRPEDVTVVNGDHLFFFERKRRMALRLYDLNLEGSDEELISALDKAYGRDAREMIPLRDFYLATGEIEAFERLQRWFHEKSGKLIQRRDCRTMRSEELHRLSPILIGRPATHSHIRKLMKSPEASHLRYRIEAGSQRVEISDIKTDEEKGLAEVGFQRNGKNAIIGASQSFGDGFGIVSRIANPGGFGCITIIAFHFYAKVAGRIVETLVEDRYASKVLEKMGWSTQRHLPESFELLFGVKISPGNLEGEGVAKLLAWCLHPPSRIRQH